MAKVIGIDLGTTYSVVSIWDEKKKEPIILPNLGGFYTTPSIVSLNKAGEVIVGEDARRNQYAAPEETVAGIKRRMGSDLKIMMCGQEFNPQTISAFILAYLKKCAEQYLGEPIYDAVITVPASFDVLQRNATREAGQIAGLNVLRLINEPTSAALAYGMMRGEEGQKTYAVYDLGGGKFDASIIQITADDVTVMGTSGNDRLGGLDMDEEVVKWILHEIQKKDGINLGRDEAVRQRLKVEVEGIKKALVVSENTILSVPNLAEINNQPYNLELPITLTRFEMVIEPMLERSLVCLEDAVASARQENMVDWEDLDGILLVGGPTRLTRIRTMLKDKLKEHCPDKEPVVKMDLNPDEGVAMGAAILAAQLLPLGKPPEEITAMSPAGLVALRDMAWDERKISGMAVPGKELYDITSYSLGVAVEGNKFHKIIYKNSALPISIAYGPMCNVADLMTELLVQVYQGEEELVAANRLIGEVRIPGLPPLPRGGHMLEIKFSLDMDDILLTVCKDLHTGREYNGTFKCDGVSRMSADDIQARRTQLIQLMKQGEREFAPVPRPAAAAPRAGAGTPRPGASGELPVMPAVPDLPNPSPELRQIIEKALAGDSRSQLMLGDRYAKGTDFPRDELQAVAWYQLAAQQGDVVAQTRLGDCHADGKGMPRDAGEAIPWYQKAAQAGYVVAQTRLGDCYAAGRGVPQDLAEAVAWYRKSADNAYTVAQTALGNCYAQGKGVPQDLAEAVAWYRKAAEQGYVVAQTSLGDCYADGRGLPKAEEQAITWYQKAADAGYVVAQTRLGDCYAVGRGVPQDPVEAAAWYLKAAEKGFVVAQTNLGDCFANGRGVPQDLEQATGWYRKAADAGYSPAKDRLNNMKLKE